jgi:hypothetical protein
MVIIQVSRYFSRFKSSYSTLFLFAVEDDPLVICQSCRHGGHASHIMEWFTDASGEPLHRTCPIADCDCRCADEM